MRTRASKNSPNNLGRIAEYYGYNPSSFYILRKVSPEKFSFIFESFGSNYFESVKNFIKTFELYRTKYEEYIREFQLDTKKKDTKFAKIFKEVYGTNDTHILHYIADVERSLYMVRDKEIVYNFIFIKRTFEIIRRMEQNDT